MKLADIRSKFTDARVDYKGRLCATFRVGPRRYITVLCEAPELIVEKSFRNARSLTPHLTRNILDVSISKNPIISVVRPAKISRKRG